MKTENGVALMMVLWVLVFMSILSMNFLSSTRWVTAGTHNLKEETQAYYMALSGYQEALNYIAADKDPAVDFIDEEGNFWVDIETPPVSGRRETQDGVVDIVISDANAKVNINFAPPDRLQKLFAFAGVKDDEIIGLIDSITDWKDPDKEHHLSGAEDDYYEALPDPYRAKNGLFDVPEELMLVKGVKPEYLYGSGGEGSRGLLSVITTFGANTININTVPLELMQLLALTEVEIEAIMKQRNKNFGGFKFIPPEFAQRGLNAMTTQFFKIDVIASTRNSPIASHVIGIMRRQPSPEGYSFTTLYWRERAETVRT
jgi:general secretion pathway protein K